MWASFGDRCGALAGMLLDAAFPEQPRGLRVRAYTEEAVALMPETRESCGLSITTLAHYHQPAIEDTIRALKYDRSTRAARLLAALLAEYLAETLADASLFSLNPPALVPMPLAPKRERARGYNQILLVLRELMRHGIDAPVRTDILLRTRETIPQTHLSRRERLRNVTGAFSVPSGVSVRGLHVFLIDDVTTTGATLAAAARALAAEGAIVHALAFARA